MIDDLRATVERAGVPPDCVRFERFEAAIAAVGAQAAEELASEPATGAEHVVTFSSSTRAVKAGRRETLLDVAERAGIEIPSLCRAGICGTCRTRVLEG